MKDATLDRLEAGGVQESRRILKLEAAWPPFPC